MAKGALERYEIYFSLCKYHIYETYLLDYIAFLCQLQLSADE